MCDPLGLVAVSAGAGYCIYRSLRGGSAPPDHTQPPHEPDVLDTLDTPSVLQSAVGVQLAYKPLIQFLRRPSNQDWIVVELSGVEIHHYNFLDVFFELLIFGRFTNGSAPEPFEGGFSECLFALISMWEVDEWEPAPGMYFTVLIPLELYDDPAALARTVLCLLRQHIQLMMDNLERL